MLATEALAFDLYGTLVDPIRIWKHLARLLPHDAQRIAELWRQKQLEYTFRLTVMERYEDFEQVTRKALDYALTATGHELETQEKQALLAQYNDLERFADVEPGLERLKAAEYHMVVFSNGSPAMLAALMEAANLSAYCAGFVSVDEVRAYKPAPRVYRPQRLGCPIEGVRLISSNAFDVMGAEATGMQASWVNRSAGVFDTLAPPPRSVASSLIELADLLT